MVRSRRPRAEQRERGPALAALIRAIESNEDVLSALSVASTEEQRQKFLALVESIIVGDPKLSVLTKSSSLFSDLVQNMQHYGTSPQMSAALKSYKAGKSAYRWQQRYGARNGVREDSEERETHVVQQGLDGQQAEASGSSKDMLRPEEADRDVPEVAADADFAPSIAL